MPIEQIATNKLSWTILAVIWVSFPIFGYKIITFLFIALVALQIFDFLTGYLSARKQKMITSKIGINGAIKKSLITIICMVVIAWSSWLKMSESISSDIIWIIPIVTLWLFIFFEIISIFENLTVIFWSSSREWKLFSILSYLTNLFFNLSVDKLKSVTESKIKEKFDNQNTELWKK